VSFLVDPAMLVATGAVLEQCDPAVVDPRVADRVVLAVFIGVSIGLYFDVPGLGFIYRPFRAHSGRDWMLNSGVFGFDDEHATPATHAVSAAIFATYPLWLRLGRHLGRRLSGGAARPVA